MSTLRLFASAREAAGTARAEIPAATVAELLEKARGQFGDRFGKVLDTSRVWVNGQPAEPGTTITDADIVAVLPPVSGGSNPAAPAPLRTDGGNATVRMGPSATVPLTPAAGPPPPAPTGPPPVPPPPERAPRRLRLVPPPPPDEPSDVGPHQQPGPTAPANVVASMGRLALAPVASPTPVPDAPPAAAPSPTPSPSPSPEARPAPSPSPAPSPATVPLPVPAGQQAVAAAIPEAAAPAPAPEPKPVAPLAVVHQAIRPHGRLGVAWAIVTTGALVAGPGWLSVWMAAIGFVAASQTASVWRKRGERPLPGFAAATAAAIPLTAATGLDHMNMVVAGAIVLTMVARMATPTKAPGRDVALTLIIGMAVGVAAASPVLLRSIDIPSALFLLACAAFYDAGAYLVGTGASSEWEGPAAGVAALIPLTMVAAVALVPPFHGGSPLLLGALAMVLAPFGPVAGSALLGDRTAYAPGLRRLDSLLVMGPIWAWCAAALLV